ncbi:YcgL domain-containing protein [Alkalimonas sp. MEB108]|uniref:YcgL domain-containing protein QWY20_00495 n=1 Tax=Alkalimonas cellulosilytica TaxID=3058395 RepID=A0ABU7J092_9GAMM|nr:YcgL domain-containing protein [Alkalimonas sp. MEB108]MEE1999920.1 YcgL domain-containing protein [Alkalimonas sp. MEB108]
MLCAVYKSLKKDQTYLYIERRDDFEKVPEALLATFGKPELVTLINLEKRTSLALTDLNKLKAELRDKGYYLQLPPPAEDLLAEHKAFITTKS